MLLTTTHCCAYLLWASPRPLCGQRDWRRKLRPQAAITNSVGIVQIALLLWDAVAVRALMQASVIAQLMTAFSKM